MAAILSASKPPPPGGDDDISKPVTGKGRSNHHSHPDTSELLDTRSQNDGSVTAGNKLSEWLTVSPYHEPEHLLDLRSLDTQNRLLALALTSLEPGSASGEYAIIKYEQAFDWTKVMARLKSLAESEGIRWRRQEFYVVEFRSKLLEKIDNDLLFKLDRESHREATHSGGLLKYWFGTPDAERRNLATCQSPSPTSVSAHVLTRCYRSMAK